MTDAGVLLERREDGVAVLRLNRPPLNTLSRALLGHFTTLATELAGDPDTKAVVVIGGERAFAAGADIDEFGGPSEARLCAAGFRAAGDALRAIPRPVIAAISGYALGGGLELALACDLRIASDAARVGQPEVLLGVMPGGGGTQRLTRLVGVARAKELIWSGRQVRADEALAIGLVDRVVPAADLEAAAFEWAASFASGPVVAMGLAKRAIDDGADLPIGAGLDLETEYFADSFLTEDAANGVKSFKDHGPGKAQFQGR
jgi:enoyl-CoA hydratase/carnithine racemase